MDSRKHSHTPAGLYDPTLEHDSCGIGFVAQIRNQKSHSILQDGLQILLNLEHRGAVGADPKAGDGAGLLLQTPDAFLRRVAYDTFRKQLPPPGEYAVGHLFLPPPQAEQLKTQMDKVVHEEGATPLGWRRVPTDNRMLGHSVRACEPSHWQIFIRAPTPETEAFERTLFLIRRRMEAVCHIPDFHIVSLSARTLCYKGMFLANQLGDYYPDLQDEEMVSALALVHQRFSTNTFPSWKLAHPYRMIAHNGEINTLRGNINWMRAREGAVHSRLFGTDLEKLWPLIPEGQSDTACLDNALEFLRRSGYSLPHAVMTLIPEAWDGHTLMDAARRAFYEYHAGLMEPWDGPAAVAFTDGRAIGAVLDRNGLRPARYWITRDDRLIMASEAGVLPVAEDQILTKWRLQPGKILLADLEDGRIISDQEIKHTLATMHPYARWLQQSRRPLKTDTPPKRATPNKHRQQILRALGYTREDLKFILTPMIHSGGEAVGSMGNDTPPAVLSSRPKLLSTYFKQNFAQVTNPPIDPIREELVMSLFTLIGPRPNLLEPKPSKTTRLCLHAPSPIVTSGHLAYMRSLKKEMSPLTLDTTFAPDQDMETALETLCKQAEQGVRQGHGLLILSDTDIGPQRIAFPALLATAAVHHHLVRSHLRTATGLVVETGEAREVHHFCTLAGYGAEAIHPYLAFELIAQMVPDHEAPAAQERYIQALNKGLLKVMSKMGISTYQSYCGAQIFDAVGLSKEIVARYFTGTHTTIDGASLKTIEHETRERHRQAFQDTGHILPIGGDYAFHLRGEDHVWSPETVRDLQHAVRGHNEDTYARYAQQVNEQNKRLMTLRGLFGLRAAQKPIPLDDVEPAAQIVKRFSTGAMSFGSISREAHTTLAIAMNRLGGKSNTGEGGEEEDRFTPLPNGDSMRSAIKQVASGRFGVTIDYLVNADVLQIKMAQGAKPGEGGQLPGHKVDHTIAKVRHSTPGVGLISPPPHHDIYSIEDLAQLIFDLKNANPQADISVKLVSEVGVGTVAAGVSKARADQVTIAGTEGGTGASPLTSIKHAGSPWEIGLAETHQTLVRNALRGRISVQVDGGLRTGRDVVIGALLGADEFGFSTAPLIAAGCIMMRKCHLNTCPVGIATQNPVLRKRFRGTPEHVINYFFFVAEEVRTLMSRLGFKHFHEMIGRSDVLETRAAIDHFKAQHLDFSRLLAPAQAAPGVATYKCEPQTHQLDSQLDHILIEKSQPALQHGRPVRLSMSVRNTNRTVGALLSHAVARQGRTLPEDTISIQMHGCAGQSFGAFLAPGITLTLEGEANDYTAKGLSGGKIIIRAPRAAQRAAHENIIVGNTVLYGATSGQCYFQGVAGERFAVRNSGAIAVVEGVGDHGCEYMTGGVVVVLGDTGRNFAAGMSGGIAYVFDPKHSFEKHLNPSMVSLDAVRDEAPPLAPAAVMADPLHFDSWRLRLLVETHLKTTGSPRAQEILDNWKTAVTTFVKIVPEDYRKALLAQRPLSPEHSLERAAGE